MRSKSSPRLLVSLAICIFLSTTSFGQVRTQDRIVTAINDSQAIPLRGNVAPKARPEFDHGRVSGSLLLPRMTLVFKPTQAQQDALTKLLAEQQDPHSPNYHKWLTPEQFADQFGVSQNDFNKVADWLLAQGFSIVDLPRSRTRIVFSGSAAQVAAAFHTEIHQFVVNGKTHYANVSEPAVPSAFAGLVAGIRALNDFRPKPRGTVVRHVRPDFTSSVSGNNFVAPDDLATIYDLKPLYAAGTNGAGQKIAIMGQTDIVLSDIATFRSVSQLPASTPKVILVPGSTDPGVVSGDIGEADLDLEWAGAAAPNASLVYVNSNNGAIDALQYAIEQDLAPVLSISYGDCEPNFSSTDIATLVALAQQANAQGQTIVAAAGDAGAADCDFPASPTQIVTSATHGLAVDIPAALPYVTGIGGTEFNEGSGTYWTTTNNSSNGSALSYIPEIGWNDTTAGSGLAAGGGGRSALFAKPTWQAAPGVPSDGKRDLPDLSFAASNQHDGYLVCSQGSCVNGYRAADGTLTVFGGTSAGAPIFAGVLTLINQKSNQFQGNANPSLYALAGSAPEAFHDITLGNNRVPCTAGTTDCPSGGTIGYDAASGYDLVTGLGSPDVFNLLNAWSTASAPAGDFQLTPATAALTMTHGASATDQLSLVAATGFSGDIVLTCAVSPTLVGVTCSVSPSSVAGSGAATLTVTAPAQVAGVSGRPWGAENALVLAAGLLFTINKPEGSRRKLKRLGGGLLLAVVLIVLLAAFGCGGASPVRTTSPVQATSPVTGTVTVQATSGSLAHSAPITVTLN